LNRGTPFNIHELHESINLKKLPNKVTNPVWQQKWHRKPWSTIIFAIRRRLNQMKKLHPG
jgi:hypothetical protein